MEISWTEYKILLFFSTLCICNPVLFWQKILECWVIVWKQHHVVISFFILIRSISYLSLYSSIISSHACSAISSLHRITALVPMSIRHWPCAKMMSTTSLIHPSAVITCLSINTHEICGFVHFSQIYWISSVIIYNDLSLLVLSMTGDAITIMIFIVSFPNAWNC